MQGYCINQCSAGWSSFSNSLKLACISWLLIRKFSISYNYGYTIASAIIWGVALELYLLCYTTCSSALVFVQISIIFLTHSVEKCRWSGWLMALITQRLCKKFTGCNFLQVLRNFAVCYVMRFYTYFGLTYTYQHDDEIWIKHKAQN